MEILNVGITTINYFGGWSISVIIFILLVISFISNNEFIFKVLLVLGMLFLFGAWYNYRLNNPVKVTTYQVILDDTISYNEFVEKYEVIKQEGRIYTVYEK